MEFSQQAKIFMEKKSFEAAIEAPRLHVELWPNAVRVQCEPGLDTELIDEEFKIKK